MNALFKNIDWNKVKYIGFDLDGTLYDEYEFIYQVYSEINIKLLKNDDALEFMLMRWLEKGSSYPFIFEETYKMFCIDKNKFNKDTFINNALKIYRNFNPRLSLSNRVKSLLMYLKKKYKLFLVTDGNKILQRNKFYALNLDFYFDKEYVLFTGDYTKDFYKPNIKILEILKNINFSNAIFFGDRDIDKEFAKRANMQFKKVYNMVEVME